MTQSDSFPRLSARTQRFTLGEPRNFVVSRDGRQLLFLRSSGPTDGVNSLWRRNVETGEEECIADAVVLTAGENTATETTTDAERARRERLRESATGITGFTVANDFSRVAFSLGGRLFTVSMQHGARAVEVSIAPGIFDPRISPTGHHIAYVRDGSLCVSDLEGNAATVCVHDPSTPQVTWGMAEFVAAEEMGRFNGFWWSPDGLSLIVEHVDNSPVDVWHIADLAHPDASPREHRYPAAGTSNARTSLLVVDVATSTRTPIVFPPGEWEYINSVHWSSYGAIVQLQTRDQRLVAVCDIDTTSGQCSVRSTDTNTCWVDLVAGAPTVNAHGQLVATTDKFETRQLTVDGIVVTPDHLHVRLVVDASDDILFVAHAVGTPHSHQLWRCSRDGSELTELSPDDAVTSAWGHADCYVTRTVTLETERARFTCAGTEIESKAAALPFRPMVKLHHVGARRVPVAIVTPLDDRPGPLPVLMNPYGGPHAQRVMSSAGMFAESQWFADQGFIVVVVDGAGTPGRGSAWEREVFRDLAGPVLADQIECLAALPALEPRADLERVGIRGWSFGGYLAALAVMRAPQHFHCGVAGAPVTDWRLYDTHYTERYLGDPRVDSIPYDSTSLLPLAPQLERPLLLVHGLADDNVVVAHTLQLSSALLASGRTHEVLPLSGVTHMTPQEDVAENLLLHQLEFLRRHLGA